MSKLFKLVFIGFYFLDNLVVTGGAIKLTRYMEERKHTKDQLKRITKARDYLT